MEKTCNNCGTPITKEYCEDNYPEVCEHWTPKKPQTNADRIRAMSDEELADFILGIENDQPNYCTSCINYYAAFPHCRATDIEVGCKAAAIKWLQQPAEGVS